jgi:hypothetical protein
VIHKQAATSREVTAVLLAVVVFCVGCPGRPIPPPPPITNALYEYGQTMVYNSTAMRYSSNFQGTLLYNQAAGCKPLPFRFTDFPVPPAIPTQPATLEVWVTDVAGVVPGQQFTYALAFDGPSGMTDETFTLIAFNPSTATSNLYDFYYKVTTNSVDPNLKWQIPAQSIQGTYSIVTTRSLNITIKFTLEQQVYGAPGPNCGPPS